MDFYKFINSCDIREHLQNLKYGFNAKEAVWLVYQSCETTVSEHIEACRYIVENMPDVPLGESNNCFIGSLDLSSKVSKTSDLSDGLKEAIRQCGLQSESSKPDGLPPIRDRGQ